MRFSSSGWVSSEGGSPCHVPPHAGNNKANINLATDPDKMKQDAKLVTDKATELTGGVTDDDKADGQASDIVKSNDLSRTRGEVMNRARLKTAHCVRHFS